MAEFIKNKSNEIGKKKKVLTIPIITIISSYFLLVGLFLFFGNFDALFKEDAYLNYRIGDVVKEDVYSKKEIYLIDKESTEKKKKLASSLAFPVFKIYDNITREVLVDFDNFINEISIYLKDGNDLNELNLLNTNLNEVIHEDQLENLLKDPLILQNLEIARDTILSIMNRGVVFTDDVYVIPPSGIMEIWREQGDDFDKTIGKYKQIPKKETVYIYIENELKSKDLSLLDLRTIEVFSSFFIRENCFIDEFNSQLNRDQAISHVRPVEILIGQDELILEKGLVVTPEIQSKLLAIRNRSENNGFISFITPFIFTIFLFSFGLVFFKIFSPVHMSNSKMNILFSSLLVIAVFISYLVITFSYIPLNITPIIFIPVALFSMLVTLLSNKKSGLLFQLVLSMALFFISDFQLEFLFVSLFSGITGCIVIDGAEKRIDIIKAGLIQGTSQAFIFTIFQVLIGFERSSLLWGSSSMFFNGFASGILALALLPILEQWMKSCTRFRLIELSDSNAPVLKNMLAKAPGTYIHSMNVANLAEMACQEIGANTLLARVGGLYHDIGKVDQSEYYIENQTDINKHDDMKPSLSAAVLKAHVKIGIEKGHDLNLPKEVVDIIQQHHATSTMKYFYNRALKEKGNTKINKDDFSYSGPNPQTREAAIVMLADTIEAATRTLKKPSLAKLEKYVWELIMEKFINGELNACSLTFQDMEFVKSSFVHVLAGHFHTRIEYPEEQKSSNKEAMSE